MTSVHDKLLECLEEKRSAALLVVLASEGSTPQVVGAKALVDWEGELLAGTIGGGLMESKALAAGAVALRENQARLFEFRMDESYSRDAGPICGGVMRIFAAPCRTCDRDAYEHAHNAARSRRKGWLLTNITGQEAGAVRWLEAGEAVETERPITDPPIQAFLENEQPGVAVEDQVGQEVFVEPVFGPPKLLVVGAGHVGQAISQQAIWLGFDVTILDDRPDFACSDRFSKETVVICGSIRDEVAKFPKDKDSYIVFVTKGHKPDAEALEASIRTSPAYIGMIGSKRKVALLRKDFLEKGIATKEQFDRVFAPIGLDIGAVTVEEIATSIMAQIVAVRRKGWEHNGASDIAIQ